MKKIFNVQELYDAKGIIYVEASRRGISEFAIYGVVNGIIDFAMNVCRAFDFLDTVETKLYLEHSCLNDADVVRFRTGVIIEGVQYAMDIAVRLQDMFVAVCLSNVVPTEEDLEEEGGFYKSEFVTELEEKFTRRVQESICTRWFCINGRMEGEEA